MLVHSASRSAELEKTFGMREWEVIPGNLRFTVDGIVLPKSEKRLGVLCENKVAPPPGK
jgi:hypothetical protein